MRLFDTHCHFENADANEIAAILMRAHEAGVERLVAVGGGVRLNEGACLARNLETPVKTVCALGYDREQIDAERPPIPLSEKLAAWGEIGLDYHYSPETRGEQLRLFGEQLEAARGRNLPVIIHTREADDDTLAMLREIRSRGVVHCYTGTPAFAGKLLDLGFFVSISGIVTFKAADNVRESALYLPDDHMLIETDAPFLAPVPMRGNPNEPAFLRHTCEFLAKLRKMSTEDFAELTYRNAENCFGMENDEAN